MVVSRKIAVSLATALVLQVAAGLLWAGAAAHRLAYLETQLAEMSTLEVRAARLEEQTAHMRTTLARIETKLDHALTREASQ